MTRLNPTITPDEASKLAASYAHKAWDLFQNIGRRALHSAHVELLSADWLFSRRSLGRSDRLWARLERVRELLAPELDGEAMGSISQFYDATSLRRSGDLTGISEALLAGTGKISHEERILESAVVTKRSLYFGLCLRRSFQVDFIRRTSVS